MTTSSWAAATPHTVYAWTEDKAEFDLIALPERIHEWEPCKTTTILANDGQQWERRCHSKALGDFGGAVTVIFQYHEKRVKAPAPNGAGAVASRANQPGLQS